MHFKNALFCLLAAATAVVASIGLESPLPSILVTECPRQATLKFNKSVPDGKAFPTTHVDLCWEQHTLQLTFKAFNETSFFFNPSQGTNTEIWQYEVMEAFIHYGTSAPKTYFEFEVNPNNVTYQSFVYNPSRVRAVNAPFDHFFVHDPFTDGITSTTTLNREAETWVSQVRIPLALFNVESPRGTNWRMNFFRTVTSPSTFPNQELGAWSSPDKPNFHITPYFGRAQFV